MQKGAVTDENAEMEKRILKKVSFRFQGIADQVGDSLHILSLEEESTPLTGVKIHPIKERKQSDL